MKRIALLTLAVVGLMIGQQKPADPPAQSMADQLKDAQAKIVGLESQITQMQATLQATGEMYQACYSSLVQAHAAAQKK